MGLSPEEEKAIEDMLRSCDTTLKACKQANSDKQKVIDAQKDELDASQKHIQELEKKESGIFESKPFWFTVGAVFVGLLVFLVKPSK